VVCLVNLRRMTLPMKPRSIPIIVPMNIMPVPFAIPSSESIEIKPIAEIIADARPTSAVE